MRILITGHMGFIGSRLWERLEDNHTLHGIDIKDGKITGKDFKMLKKKKKTVMNKGMM